MRANLRSWQTDGLAHLELDRPETINALSHEMLRGIAAEFNRWRDDPAVSVLVLSGAGERGFCSGGDVRQVWREATAGNVSAALDFFHDEYQVNAMVASYPKPTVALMRGVCMGGGVGLAGHSQVRLVFHDSKVAMPETKIGFTPDVGGSWLLGRAPGFLGERLGLHSDIMGPADAIAAGFADFYFSPEREADLPAALADAAKAPDHAREILGELACDPGPPSWAGLEAVIDQVYSAPSVLGIIDRLGQLAEASPPHTDWANTRIAELRALSPTALTIALPSIRAGRRTSLVQSLARENRLVRWLLINGHDTLEGIRAVLIDKDHAPNWNPARLEDLLPAHLPSGSLYREDPE